MKNRFEFSFKKLIVDQTIEFKYYYLFGIIFLYLTHKIQSELPFLAKELADLVSTTNNHINVSKFFWFALGIIVFRTGSRILFFYPARILQKFLREELLSKLQSANPIRYKDVNAGQLFQYLTGDIDQIRALIGFVGLQGGNFIIGLLVLIPKMIAFNAPLLIALIPMLVSFLIFTLVLSKNKEFFKKTQEAQGDVQNLIIESYQGKKTIKNFQAENEFMRLFDSLSLKELYYFYRSSLGLSITFPLITFGVGLSMLWGAYLIKMQNLGPSTLIIFSGFIFLLMEPLGYLSWIGVVVSRSSASWKRLNDLNLKLITVIQAEKDILSINKNKQINDFYFNYWDKELSFKLQKNKWNILVSKTGHGKTVLIEKMAQILKDKNASISLVFQDPYIYNDSILNNLFLGRVVTESMKEEAKFYLKLLGLDYLENNLDSLLLLEVGENGKRLSGGQQKRLALTRSILSEADYLLWDDPFSSVDLILEKEIIQNLKAQEKFKNKTLILTSHRFTTVRSSDYVFFIDKELGIIESGSTNEILNQESKLYEYFQNQMV